MKTQFATLCLIMASALFTASHPTPQVTSPTSTAMSEKDIKLLISAPKSYQIIGEEVRNNKLKLNSKKTEECANHWEQCGGKNWTGPTCCKTGYVCHEYNEWYYQCIE
ncbi:hypothetical protein BCR36DRAFT_407102 [Piromyces finnis]|uniref:CBM1 domain-containing protein n=1 Tax=Piromyces finnis TaxID=1754191 RepID=A0A1Y1UYG4_9FUNG|nr:hypothetical protein BCR36DRAFT_407102 [Piromyces finnis]|eukprot:ORX42313.1 hypothetical protein BCR36DRAFT_407102 [Piromyces finnis]